MAYIFLKVANVTSPYHKVNETASVCVKRKHSPANAPKKLARYDVIGQTLERGI